jgi:hypothetical protein
VNNRAAAIFELVTRGRFVRRVEDVNDETRQGHCAMVQFHLNLAASDGLPKEQRRL